MTVPHCSSAPSPALLQPETAERATPAMIRPANFMAGVFWIVRLLVSIGHLVKSTWAWWWIEPSVCRW